jgi:hypothetical protein
MVTSSLEKAIGREEPLATRGTGAFEMPVAVPIRKIIAPEPDARQKFLNQRCHKRRRHADVV